MQQLAPGDTLTETFTYTITDKDGDSSNETLTITITGTDDAPVAVADTNSIAEDAVSPVSGNVKTNDTLGDGTAAQNTISWGAESASYGSITKNADGSYSYTLNSGLVAVQQLAVGDTLTETFTYTITDKDGDSSSEALTITITGTDDLPVAVADANSIDEDTATPINGDVKANDTLGDGTAAENTISWGAETASYGSITKNADGSYSYTLNSGLVAVQQLAVAMCPSLDTTLS